MIIVLALLAAVCCFRITTAGLKPSKLLESVWCWYWWCSFQDAVGAVWQSGASAVLDALVSVQSWYRYWISVWYVRFLGAGFGCSLLLVFLIRSCFCIQVQLLDGWLLVDNN
jgi:hypothetical protein